MYNTSRFFGFCDFGGDFFPNSNIRNTGYDWASFSAAEAAMKPFRLCLIDSAGAFVVDDRGVLGIVAGESYMPESGGGAWRQGCLTETAMQAYHEYGPSGLPKINGLFSAVLWDSSKKKLIVFRDGSCSNFLYWSNPRPEVLAFASDVEDLFGYLNIKKEIAKYSVHEYLRFLDISTPNTIYNKVYSVEPGTPLIFDGKTLKIENNDDEILEDLPQEGNLSDPTARLDALLTKSISKRLDKSGKTGIFLSGGIDSSLIASIAADLSKENIQAFTVGFEIDQFDETKVAARVASHLGIRHQSLVYSFAEYKKQFSRFLASIDQPFADPAGLPTYLAMRDCAPYAQVMLDGTGADTLVGIMPPRHRRISVEYIAVLPRNVRSLLARILCRLGPLNQYGELFDFDDPEEVFMRWKGWRKDEIAQLCGESVDLKHTRFYRIFSEFSRRDHFGRYSALMGSLPDDRVHYAAKNFGLSVRFPFWDPEVAAFVKALDMQFRYINEENKPILKYVLGKRVPRALWDTPKHGFNFPFIQFMKMDDYELINQFLSDSQVGKVGLLDPDMVRRFVARFQSGDESLSFRIWALLVFHCWYLHRFLGSK